MSKCLLRLLIFVLLLVVAVSSKAFVEDDSSRVKISPSGINGYTHVVKAGGAFRLSCVFNDSGILPVNEVVWQNENEKEIDGETSSSRFTVGLHEHKTHFKKVSLVFTPIAMHDAGDYTCVASDVGGKFYRRSVHIVVVVPIKWNEDSAVVGEMLGEPLTIDCGAKGDPEPEIAITDKDGEPLDASEFTVIGSSVTIEKLTKEHQNTSIKCLATQVFKTLDTTSVEQNEIRVEVWYPPEFAAPSIDRYAIIDRPAYVFCNVTASNPPAAHFHFFKDLDELKDVNQYALTKNLKNQSATLKIFKMSDEHFGEYTCEVNNGKAKAQQRIYLKEASPPDQVRASFYKATDDSILWKIEDAATDGLPIVSYIVEYAKLSMIDHLSSTEEQEERDRLWKTHAARIVWPKSDDGLLRVSGLRKSTMYEFRFSAENEAGAGEEVSIRAATESDDSSVKAATSLASSTVLLCVVAVLLLFY